ncbi:Mor transcription activator family protein [Undibacterium danionis]|uniref:Mor transcription activator family protein n=1 Tax=Undibacterium danionis TaxID=1812100 RepID=A0ABV6ID28_9BURK
MSDPNTDRVLSSAEGTVQLLIRLIGEGAAMRMMDPKALGGARYAFPKKETGLGAQSYAYLVDVVGTENAKRLCEHFDGDDVYIPKMTEHYRHQRNVRIVNAYNNGTSIRELVRDFEISDRRVWEILKTTDMTKKDHHLDEGQASLF